MNLTPGITVVIPTIPNRHQMLTRAVHTVRNQLLPAEAIVIVQDNRGDGAAVTRTRGLNMVTTEWVAFLDDDDELYPEHLQALMMGAESTGADFIFPWFDVVGGSDPFPENEFREWTVEEPHQTTVTFLVRTEAARAVDGFTDEQLVPGLGEEPVDAQGHRAGEEFRFVVRLGRAGYKIVHLNQRTWRWNHHGANTSGLPSRVQPGQQDPALNVDTIRETQVGYANF